MNLKRGHGPKLPPSSATFQASENGIVIRGDSCMLRPFIMPSRGRHQSTSKECREILRRIEALDGVLGVIIGRSYGGKSLGTQSRTGSIRIQRKVPGGLKAVTQSAKGLQEIFIRTEAGTEEEVAATITGMS